MKKRILAVFAALVMCVSMLSGCNSNNETSGAGNSGNTTNDELVQMIAQLTSEIAELRNALVLPAGSLTGQLNTISDEEGDELNKLFEIHEMNLLASPSTGTKVKARDWSKYTSDSAKSNMSDAEAEFYDRLYQNCETYLNDPSHVKTGSSYSYVSTITPYSDLGLSKSEAYEVYWWFKFNNPQFYFVGSSAFSSTHAYIVIYDFVMKLPDVAATTNEMFDKLDSWIAQCGKESNDWDKVTAANKLICENIIYSPDVKAGVEGASGGKNQSMYSVLMSDDTVCSGYAQTFTAMANSMGIDTYTVCSETHAWNAAQFEDSDYYYVDVCWNDLDNENVYKEEWVGVGTDFASTKTAHELETRSLSFAPNIQTDDYDGNDKIGGLAAPSIRIGGSGGRFVKVEWDAISGAEKYAYQVTSGVSSYADTSTTDNYLVAVIPEGVASVDIKVRAVGTVNGKTAYSKWSETTASLGSSTGLPDKPSNVTVKLTDSGEGIKLSWDANKNVDGWMYVRHGSDSTLTSVTSKGIYAQKTVGLTWASWKPEKDTYFSIMSIKRSGNMETYSEPVQFKYNINDGMRLVENTTTSGGNSGSSGTSNSNSSSGTSGSNIVTKVYSTGTYVGEMVNGVINGQGKMTWSDGAVYEGEWKDAAYNGYGKYTGVDGSTYEGYFVNGKRTGQGKSVSADGNTTYEGEFKDSSLISGTITKILSNGTYIYESKNFVNNKMNGSSKRTIKFDNGDVSILSGTAKDNVISGNVTLDYTWSSGTYYHYEGEYDGGATNGVKTTYYTDGARQVETGERKDGKLYNGTLIMYNADNSVRYNRTYVNGEYK